MIYTKLEVPVPLLTKGGKWLDEGQIIFKPYLPELVQLTVTELMFSVSFTLNQALKVQKNIFPVLFVIRAHSMAHPTDNAFILLKRNLAHHPRCRH